MSLEVAANEFYQRLRTDEMDQVRGLVDFTGQFMHGLEQGPFLIAGVGGILWKDDPNKARDINIEVSGNVSEKYGHLSNAVGFSRLVRDYFYELLVVLSQGRDLKELRVPKGSGRFKGWNQKYRLRGKGDIVELTTNLESFRMSHGTKGVQVKYRGSRMIDVQFAYRKLPDMWKEHQEHLDNMVSWRSFPYAVLLEDKSELI